MKLSFQHAVCRTIAAVFAAWLSAPAAFGAGSAPVPVNVLVRNADAIVIAKILDGIMAQDVATLHLEVEKSLKGDVRPGSILSADCRLRGEAATYATPIEKDRGLFFLRSANGSWSIVSATNGNLSSLRRVFLVLPANSTRKPFADDARASIHERIVGELAGAREAGGNLPEGGAVDFMWEFRSNPSPAMKALFSQFKTSTNPVLRAAGLRASLHDEDGQALSALGDGLGRLNAAEMGPITEEIQYYLVTTDSRAVARLGRLAVSEASPAQLRKASLRALARSHTAETLHYLAEFLDDPDAELRSLASGGMAMFANNVPAGGSQPASGPWKYCTYETLRNSAMDAKAIQDNPGIVAFWKSWWAEHRAELP
jgi:hypothetical protein